MPDDALHDPLTHVAGCSCDACIQLYSDMARSIEQLEDSDRSQYRRWLHSVGGFPSLACTPSPPSTTDLATTPSVPAADEKPKGRV